MEEFLVYGLFPLSLSFGLGEVADGEMPVSKLSAPMPDFPVARLLKETNDQFRVRVELATASVVGQYTRGEHKVCINVSPNRGRVNHVFEHAGVLYEPRLEHGSEASEEATKKRKQDACVGSQAKRMKVSDLKGASAKIMVVKDAQSKLTSGAKVVPGASVLPNAMASSVASMSMVMVAMAVTSPRGGVLKINAGMKRSGAALSPATKGKQARLDVGPPLTSIALLKVSAQP
jgi:hypothetical protein